ncbi:MAG: hypothetical protein EZS28_017412 [Streblomastix strix]|uniref:Uncharacterized protein n=1 Tax=Streblomastix strix TaxID=222440 RepID=A0A5J4VWF9_9EUKA|nr:MAG: hypothetical protein EZS28_017412 [Streblomastix strix]
MEKGTRCERIEQRDCRHPLQDARFERGETYNLTWRLEHFIGLLPRISPSNNPNKIITIPSIPVPEQTLLVQNIAIWNQTITNILHNSNGAGDYKLKKIILRQTSILRKIIE